MPTVDERVVSMAFENQVFEQRIAQTMTSLTKLNDAIAKTGTGPNGLENIEKSANKVTLNQPMSALDRLKAKFGRSGADAAQSMSDVERAGSKVTLEAPTRSVDKLQGKMDHLSAGQTFTDIEQASNKVELGGLSKAIDTVQNKFGVLEGAAAVALGNIATKAVSKGANWAKSFGFGPILDGLHEYQTNLKAIQTVQANTDQPLPKINKALNELNHYSDQTIYNFSEMTKNVGTFTAAGVDLKTSVSSIKGIANLAALSGSSSQQAATAMYQLSQAISSGRVGLQDWNSVVNAGMGGKKLQNALAQTSIAMGNMKDSSVKLEGPMKKLTINGKSFRESIQAKPGQKPWLTSEVLVNTLATLDGRFSKAALSAELTTNGLKKYTAAQVQAKIEDSRAALEKKNGVKYTDAQFKALQQLSDSAFKSATEVKTLGQVFDVAKETIGSGWSASFQNIFGNLNEAKKLFTGMSNTINAFINKTALARNTVLAGWKEMGGRADVIQGLKNIFNTLFDVLGKIGKAFREVFPRKTAEDLTNMSRKFAIFTAHLNNSPQIIDNLARTFKGLFAILHIGWTLIKDVGKVIFDLLGIVGKGSGGFLNFTGGIGDFLASVDKAISKGGALTGFFKGLENVLRVPLELLKSAGRAVFGLFGGFDAPKADEVKKGIDKVGTALTPLEQFANRVKAAWQKLGDMFDKVAHILSPIIDKVKTVFSSLGDTIGNALQNIDMEKVLLGFQTGFLGGILLVLKKAFSGGSVDQLTGGFLGKVKETLGAVTGQLNAMQQQVKANIILKIAGAVVALAAGIYIISTIEPKRLASSMTAIAVGLGELGAVLKLMEGGKVATASMPIIASSMLILAGALVVMAAAMKIMSTMSWEELAKGLVGLGGSMAAVGLGMKFLNPATIIPTAAGLLILAGAMVVMAVAVKIFAEMKWEELAKGLVGMGGALVVLAAGLALMGPEILLVGPGLIAAGIGMTLMAGAVSAMGAIDPKKMLSGILGLGLALAALGVAMMLIPPTIGLQAAGLVIMGVALGALAAGISVFASMGAGKLAKGIIAMGIALGILAVNMALFVGSAAGSASFMLAAAGLAIFVPTLALLGSLPWGVILKGLATMAVSLGVIAVVGAVAAPGITALGTALLILGAALVLIGTAVFLTGKGLQALGDNGVKGVAVLIAAISGFVALLPTLVINFVKGLVAIIEEIAKVAPKVVIALGVILDTVIAFVIEAAPKMATAISALITAILNVLAQNAGPMIQAGWHLIQQLLTGVSNNIGSVVTKVGDIITQFLNAFATQAPRIIQAGAKALGAYLAGIATAIPQLVLSGARVVASFISGITKSLPNVVAKAVTMITTFLAQVAKRIPELAAAGARVVVAYLHGIADHIDEVINAGVRLIKKFIFGIATAIPELADAAAKAVIKFVNGLAKAIRDNDNALADAGINLAGAMIDGIATGLTKLDKVAIDAAKKLAGKLPHWVRKVLGISSPSTVFAEIGGHVVTGLAQGLGDHKPVLDGASAMSNGLIDTFKNTLGIHSPSQALKDIGKEVGHGFRDGLEGSKDDIRGAFASMREKIASELKTQRDNLRQENDNLAGLQKQYVDKLNEITRLRSEKKPDKQAINSAIDEANGIRLAISASANAIKSYKDNISALSSARYDLRSGMADDKKQLVALSKDLDQVSKDLDKAKQARDDAKKARDDAEKSYADQYSQTPDIANLMSEAMAQADMTWQERADALRKKQEEDEKRRRIDQVANYKKALAEQILATKKYQETLQKLRELGLDDTTYKKLLAQGLAGQDFADQLLATGKGGIDELNKMDDQLIAESTDLAKQAAYNLYQAGVDAAQGLVDGLKAKKKDLEDAMSVLADSLVNRIKADLGIRSPSKVFAEMGKFATQGLVQGLKSSKSAVVDAAAAVGDDAASALTSSLANIKDQVGSEIDTDLTITPVLDLSQVTKDAQTMRDLTNVVPISAAASYGQASAISSETTKVSEDAAAANSAAPSIKLEQNNYSPESLSETEIYRQTKNQFSQLQRNLGLPGRINSA